MLKILIVEDNADNRELLCQTLEYDYEVIIAMDGQEALEKARAAAPDLILMDLSMPVMTGWEATEKLKDAGGKLKEEAGEKVKDAGEKVANIFKK